MDILFYVGLGLFMLGFLWKLASPNSLADLLQILGAISVLAYCVFWLASR